MNSFKNISVYIFIAILMFTIQGCSKDANSKMESKNEKQKKEITIPVEAESVKRGDISSYYHTTTSLIANKEASVAAKVSGEVIKLFIEEGDKVERGQILAQLDTVKVNLELIKLKAMLNKLQKELARQKKVYKKKLVSSDIYEKLTYDYQSQKASYALMKLNKEYASIRAPISGIISKRYIKEGNLVTLNQVTYDITDLDSLEGISNLPEIELNRIQLNQKINLSFDAMGEKIYQGYVKRISPIIDSKSGTIKVTLVWKTTINN